MATAQQPTYQAYTVIKREDQDDYWLNIGAAFPHADGEGFNVMLQALPIGSKIVLRPFKQEEKETPANNGKRRQDTGRGRK
jgi:hypothetical protein